jgi:hypothetical protein
VAGDDTEVLEISGRHVRITSPGKVVFPGAGATKLDLARYYLAVAEPLMAAMGGRPVLLQRFPKGSGGPSFFQKRVTPTAADPWLTTTMVSTPNGTTSNSIMRPVRRGPATGGPRDHQHAVAVVAAVVCGSPLAITGRSRACARPPHRRVHRR